MLITLQPIQLATVVLRESTAHWITYAKIALSVHGQEMPQPDAALTDNTKDYSHSAKTAHQERI
jgi:hypothetical protein